MLAVLAIGSSLTRPPVFGMISNLTSSREQGATIGVVVKYKAHWPAFWAPMTVIPLFYHDPRFPVCGLRGARTHYMHNRRANGFQKIISLRRPFPPGPNQIPRRMTDL